LGVVAKLGMIVGLVLLARVVEAVGVGASTSFLVGLTLGILVTGWSLTRLVDKRGGRT
jgi:hypothetical protein